MILTGENRSNGMSMEHWWNDTDKRKMKYWEKNIIQCWWYTDEYVWSME